MNENESIKETYFALSRKESKNEKVFVFFHDILETIFEEKIFRDTKILKEFENDFGILIPEYRGEINNYSNNEENFDKMIQVCATWLKNKYADKKIILGGHSFGC